MDVQIVDRAGHVHTLPEEPATVLAENLHNGPFSYSREASQSAGRKIEARLTGAEHEPIDFDSDEQLEVLKALNETVVGFDTPETRALYWGFAGPQDPSATQG